MQSHFFMYLLSKISIFSCKIICHVFVAQNLFVPQNLRKRSNIQTLESGAQQCIVDTCLHPF
jgi:hypothetical protein